MFNLAVPTRKRLTEAELRMRGKFQNSHAFWKSCRLIAIRSLGQVAQPDIRSVDIKSNFNPCELNVKESSNNI